MAKAALIEPDLDFKQQILGLGTHDLSSCYQCGTCSVICPISTAEDPFPRKEMIWAQWGLKDRLMADSTIWTCHQCGVCNTYCPRDAKPADVMAAVRDYSITHYAWPKFMGQAVDQPSLLPLLFGFPAVVLLAMLAALGNLSSLPEGTIVFSKFLPIIYIEIFYSVAVGIAVIAAIKGGLNYWNALRAEAVSAGKNVSSGVVSTVLTILKHTKFRQCETERTGTRRSYKEHLGTTHMVLFYGFIGLVITTTAVGIGIYAFGYLTPWPLWHPIKILGNVSGAAVIAACLVFAYRRRTDKEKAGKTTYSDWLFLAVLGSTAMTGYFSEWLRLADVAILAYWSYFLHLLLVFFLLAYLPYSKFAHLSYRFVAMLFAAGNTASDQ